MHAEGGRPRDYSFTPGWDNAIRLPGIEIYRRPEDRPAALDGENHGRVRKRRKRMVRIPAGRRPRNRIPRASRALASGGSRLQCPRRSMYSAIPTEEPRCWSKRRRWSAARWQIEQAICNLRSADLLAYQPSGAGKRLAMIDAVRYRVLEPASTNVDLTAISNNQISAQIGLDAAFLLRRLEPDREIEETVAKRIERVRELGYG